MTVCKYNINSVLCVNLLVVSDRLVENLSRIQSASVSRVECIDINTI